MKDKLLNQSTSGDYDAVSIKGIDAKKKVLYYLSCEISPMERRLYSTKFNGKGKKLITEKAGNHRVNMAPGGSYFIDSYSDINTPSTIDLRDGKGDLLTQLAGHKNASAQLEAYEYAGKELFSFTASDGQTHRWLYYQTHKLRSVKKLSTDYGCIWWPWCPGSL